jgi:hypothetical protein
MSFQEGEDGGERKRPSAVSSCWFNGEWIAVTGGPGRCIAASPAAIGIGDCYALTKQIAAKRETFK